VTRRAAVWIGASLALLAAVSGGCAGSRRRAPEALQTPQAPVVSPVAGVETEIAVEPVPPAAEPAPRPAPPLPPAAAPPPRLVLPAAIRIGLSSDLEVVTLPCCDGEVVAEIGGERFELVSPVTVKPAAVADSPTVWRLQVTAVRDEQPAADIARRLAARTGVGADARFDARSGLYRVRVGAWPTKAEAEAAARRFRTLGLDGAWVVAEGGGISSPALEVIHRGRSHRVTGRRFAVRAPDGGGLRVDGRRYRGAIEVFLNDRGRLNIVNVLGLEEYLRGVVPRELGPGQYPEIEALKAQAVAARSYTLRNRGGFDGEGYDLCGTPQCQVYGGMDDEHPLSDRAVRETAGEVLMSNGEVVDALYSATCGGHTENVEVVFPLRAAGYLRGVPCIESGGALLRARVPAESWPDALLRRAVGGELRLEEAAGVDRALRALVIRAGVPVSDDRLRSLDRREVQRFLASLLDLAADARLFVRAEELDYLIADPPPEWTAEDRRFAAWLAKSGLFYAADRGRAVGGDEVRELLLRVALFVRVVEERLASFSALRGDAVVVREDGVESTVELPADLLTIRREGGTAAAGNLLLVAGDTLRLYSLGGRLVALEQEVDRRGAAFDRAHERSSWTRFRSETDLAALVGARYPGFAMRDFEVLERGVSGRVGRLRMTGAQGDTIDLEGLAIRWTFDLPDTLWSSRRLRPEGGAAGWRFTGRGWGHGVGMCQTGAFGMARRGYDYRTILTHYYSGVRIERLAADTR
jgi:stage II sporulation protein D